MPMRAIRIALTATAAVLVALAAGCSSSNEPKLHTVSGTVTYEGQPVQDGSITFQVGGPNGRSYSGPITNGTYKVKSEAGNATVAITASRIIPGKFDKSNGTPEPVGEMYIPAKYNSATKLTAEIKSGGGEIPFDLTK